MSIGSAAKRSTWNPGAGCMVASAFCGGSWACAESASASVSNRVLRCEAILFDMDGVLVLSEPFIAEASIRMFAEMLEQGVAQGDAEKMHRYHGVIVQESQRLGLLIAKRKRMS